MTDKKDCIRYSYPYYSLSISKSNSINLPAGLSRNSTAMKKKVEQIWNRAFSEFEERKKVGLKQENSKRTCVWLRGFSFTPGDESDYPSMRRTKEQERKKVVLKQGPPKSANDKLLGLTTRRTSLTQEYESLMRRTKEHGERNNVVLKQEIPKKTSEDVFGLTTKGTTFTHHLIYYPPMRHTQGTFGKEREEIKNMVSKQGKPKRTSDGVFGLTTRGTFITSEDKSDYPSIQRTKEEFVDRQNGPLQQGKPKRTKKRVLSRSSTGRISYPSEDMIHDLPIEPTKDYSKEVNERKNVVLQAEKTKRPCDEFYRSPTRGYSYTSANLSDCHQMRQTKDSSLTTHRRISLGITRPFTYIHEALPGWNDLGVREPSIIERQTEKERMWALSEYRKRHGSWNDLGVRERSIIERQTEKDRMWALSEYRGRHGKLAFRTENKRQCSTFPETLTIFVTFETFEQEPLRCVLILPKTIPLKEKERREGRLDKLKKENDKRMNEIEEKILSMLHHLDQKMNKRERKRLYSSV